MLFSVGNYVSLVIWVFICFLERICFSSVRLGSVEFKSFFVIFLFMVLMIFFGVILMLYIDGWMFIEGCYFIFISVFIIGFGDYVVNDGEFKFINYVKMFVVNFIIVLIIVGLCVVFSVFCLVSVIIEER